MKQILLVVFIILIRKGYGQILFDANGPGNTYKLITSVLAPGHNLIEVLECCHMEFGGHIDEFFDNAKY